MKKQNKKKIIITVTAVGLVVAIGLGVWFGVSRGRSEPVKVFAFNSVGMTEYWGDSQESYGPVSTDKIQTVFLSSTQTVTEMKVAQGDEVKKGDVLMTFDTTLSDLQLERKRLEVEKLKLDLETAQKKLKDIRNMKPMSIVSPDDFDNSDEDSDTRAKPQSPRKRACSGVMLHIWVEACSSTGSSMRRSAMSCTMRASTPAAMSARASASASASSPSKSSVLSVAWMRTPY